MALALFGAVLGLVFAAYSTFDYAAHLDRRLHDVHCSFIPGAPATGEGDACRAAMYSPYSAVLKDRFWGGVPISLFAMGAFCFFGGFAAYLLVLGGAAPRKAVQFFAAVSVTPSLVSLLMLVISATQVGAFCKTCVGIYISSALVTAGGLLAILTLREDTAPPAAHARPGAPYTPDTRSRSPRRPEISWLLPIAWLAVLGMFTLLPAVVYADAAPDHSPFLARCGTLKHPKDEKGVLVSVRSGRSTKAVTLFEDPLCPTCKGFHDRLVSEGIYDNLDIRLALFPLDNSCNWMLDTPLHPGACMVSRVVLCVGERAREAMEWAYEKQEYLTRAGKAGEPTLRAVIKQKWGDAVLRCVDDKKTEVLLNEHLHYAAENNIPVSTPQMYLDHERRFCDEDTDIGLVYTFAQVAPEVLK